MKKKIEITADWVLNEFKTGAYFIDDNEEILSIDSSYDDKKWITLVLETNDIDYSVEEMYDESEDNLNISFRIRVNIEDLKNIAPTFYKNYKK